MQGALWYALSPTSHMGPLERYHLQGSGQPVPLTPPQEPPKSLEKSSWEPGHVICSPQIPAVTSV